LETVVSSVVNGLVMASIYILVAIGFALIFSLMRILNFAHGVIYMVGGYVCYYWGTVIGLDAWAALLMSAIVIGLFGLCLNRFLFRILHGDFNRTLMLSLALIIILQTAADVTVGAYVKRVPSILPGIISIAGVSLSRERVITFAIAFGLLSALTLFIRKTMFGRQILAVAEDRDAASLQGINVNLVIAITFSVACALAAVAGSLMGAITALTVYMGDFMLVKAIALVIIAGMGSIGGLFISGLIIGFIDGILPIYISGAGSDVVAFAFAIFILLIRPQGFFGRKYE
jgi:branched-chain amino acid transport system permease protein